MLEAGDCIGGRTTKRTITLDVEDTISPPIIRVGVARHETADDQSLLQHSYKVLFARVNAAQAVSIAIDIAKVVTGALGDN